MMKTRNARGVTLLEGLIAMVILVTGVVGVFQGVAIASQQNVIADRFTRAAIIGQELSSAVSLRGLGRNTAASGLFSNPLCTGSPSTGLAPYVNDLTVAATNLNAQGFTTVCYVDVDTDAPTLTPGYSTDDDTQFTRALAVYTNPGNPDFVYVGVVVSWRATGRVMSTKRFVALYDTSRNQTNVEF